MFVPVIPIVPNTTVVNKTIVYSDTVLNIKEKGVNIQVSSIDNVKESELERCLKTIFENNKDAIFHTIQYSKNDKKVYFYTNKEINTKVWNESKTRTYEQLKSTEILNEIKNIFTQEVNKDEDVISLYHVSHLMKEMDRKYSQIETSYKCIFEQKLSPSRIIIYRFDYDSNELQIGVSFLGDYYKMCFTKQDGDLFITKSEYYDSQKVLLNLGNDLSILYDKFMEFKEFKKQYSYGVKTINSMFYANVSSSKVSFLNSSGYFKCFNNGFEIISNSYTPNYEHVCNSTNILNIVKGNEDELFKRIFVKIEDMPKWCQSSLYEIRKQELEKEQAKEKKKSKSLKNKFIQFIDRHF